MSIRWDFLPATYECEVKGKTMYVYFQQDISLIVNNEITLKLPIRFEISSGAVVLDVLDKRLKPMKQVFLLDSDSEGLTVTFYNKSYQTIDKKSGDIVCILRHVN